jgi:ATPase subunit of ABC transporter with duplicated ATPase domains
MLKHFNSRPEAPTYSPHLKAFLKATENNIARLELTKIKRASQDISTMLTVAEQNARKARASLEVADARAKKLEQELKDAEAGKSASREGSPRAGPS